jgi:hypothetical protein
VNCCLIGTIADTRLVDSTSPALERRWTGCSSSPEFLPANHLANKLSTLPSRPTFAAYLSLVTFCVLLSHLPKMGKMGEHDTESNKREVGLDTKREVGTDTKRGRKKRKGETGTGTRAQKLLIFLKQSSFVIGYPSRASFARNPNDLDDAVPQFNGYGVTSIHMSKQPYNDVQNC